VDLGLAELEHLRLEGGLDQVGEVGPGIVGVVDLGIAEVVAPGTVAEELVPGIVGVVVLEIAGEVGLGTVGEGAVPEIAVEVVAVPGTVEAGLDPGTAAAVDTVVG